MTKKKTCSYNTEFTSRQFVVKMKISWGMSSSQGCVIERNTRSGINTYMKDFRIYVINGVYEQINYLKSKYWDSQTFM